MEDTKWRQVTYCKSSDKPLENPLEGLLLWKAYYPGGHPDRDLLRECGGGGEGGRGEGSLIISCWIGCLVHMDTEHRLIFNENLWLLYLNSGMSSIII